MTDQEKGEEYERGYIGGYSDAKKQVQDAIALLRHENMMLRDVIDSRRSDAKLGRAVRRMPELHALWKRDKFWYCETSGLTDEPMRGDTPEAALKAAGLMEEDK